MVPNHTFPLYNYGLSYNAKLATVELAVTEVAAPEPGASSASNFDFRSKSFKLALTFAFIWFLIASYLAWQRYEDNKPSDPSFTNASESRCFFRRLHFEEDGDAFYRNPTPSEVQECLGQEAEIDAEIYESSVIWARNSAAKWFALWGLAIPMGILLLIALRGLFIVNFSRAWQLYWRWLNSSQ